MYCRRGGRSSQVHRFVPKRFVSDGTSADARPLLALSAENFTSLANLIASFPQLSRTSHFLFVPGPLDPWGSTTMPRPHIPDSFVSKVKARLPKAHFVSNPCRIKYFDQEIVIYREDLMGRMLRNLIGLKGGPGAEVDMKKYVGPLALTSAWMPLVLTTAAFCHLDSFAARPDDSRPMPSVAAAALDPTNALGLRPRPEALPDADRGTSRADVTTHRPRR